MESADTPVLVNLATPRKRPVVIYSEANAHLEGVSGHCWGGAIGIHSEPSIAISRRGYRASSDDALHVSEIES